MNIWPKLPETGSKMKKPTIFAVFMIYEIYVLIPTKSGKGFLKRPLGHNENALGRFLRGNIKYDVSGINGYLEFDTGYIDYTAHARAKIEKEVIQTIANYYGYDYQIIPLADMYAKIDPKKNMN